MASTISGCINNRCHGRNTANSCAFTYNGVTYTGDSGPTQAARGMVSGCQSAGNDASVAARPIDDAFYFPGCANEWQTDGFYYTNMRSKDLFEWVDGRKLSETVYANWRWCNNDPDGEVVSS